MLALNPERRSSAGLARARYAGSPRGPAAARKSRSVNGRVPIASTPARAAHGRLLSQDLSWYRITSRDLSAPPVDDAGSKPSPRRRPRSDQGGGPTCRNRRGGGTWPPRATCISFRRSPNGATVPRCPALSRDLLEEASGITIPSSQFVLKVILAYLLAVVPLNWLICRFVLNRREWAWIVVPLVALGFAIGVERVAAHDMGYDTASDEIDLLEVHGDYPRAHLTRLVSLYTTGRSSSRSRIPTIRRRWPCRSTTADRSAAKRSRPRSGNRRRCRRC